MADNHYNDEAIDWENPPQNIKLSDRDVHLWRLWLDAESQQVLELSKILSAEELGRASRFRSSTQQRHYVVCHGFLRVLLGQYLAVGPESLQLASNSYGKPRLAAEFSVSPLHFNLSHSHNLAVVAVSLGCEIGVDVERIDSQFANEQIAERFFAPEEIAALRSLAPDVQIEAFFRCWTRKECFIKAKGEGLSYPLDQFVVSLLPGEIPRLIDVRQDSEECWRWSLRSFVPARSFIGALAVEREAPMVRYYEGSVLPQA